MAFKIISEYPQTTIGGVCFFCLSSRRKTEQLVDCQKEVDFEGGVVVCETCVIEMSNLVGGLPKKRAENLRNTAVALEEALSYANETIRVQNDAIIALRSLDAASVQ